MTLVYISGALVVGIFAGVELDLLAWPFFLTAALIVLGGLFLRKHPRVIYVLMLAALLAGVGRGAVSPVSGPPDELQGLAGLDVVEIAGVVEDYPEPRGGLTRFRFDIHGYRSGESWVESSGLLLVMARPPADVIEGRAPPFFRYGDSLVLTGALAEPPVLEDFDWREHLAREGVHYLMDQPEVRLVGSGHGSPPMQLLYRFRSEMAASLGMSLPEPHASLTQALLLGIRSGLPSDLRDDLAHTGTTHLVAISGLHVGILVGLVSLGSAAALGRRGQLYVVVPLLFVWVYAVLTGFSPPVARAAIMASLYLWAIYLGRQRSGLTALSAAAAVMVSGRSRNSGGAFLPAQFPGHGGTASSRALVPGRGSEAGGPALGAGGCEPAESSSSSSRPPPYPWLPSLPPCRLSPSTSISCHPWACRRPCLSCR